MSSWWRSCCHRNHASSSSSSSLAWPPNQQQHPILNGRKQPRTRTVAQGGRWISPGCLARPLSSLSAHVRAACGLRRWSVAHGGGSYANVCQKLQKRGHSKATRTVPLRVPHSPPIRHHDGQRAAQGETERQRSRQMGCPRQMVLPGRNLARRGGQCRAAALVGLWAGGRNLSGSLGNHLNEPSNDHSGRLRLMSPSDWRAEGAARRWRPTTLAQK